MKDELIKFLVIKIQFKMCNLFFILSFSRSGSTLLCNLLNNNKDIDLVNESWLISTTSILGWKKINYNKQKYLIQLFNKTQNNKTNHKNISLNVCEKKEVYFNDFYKKIIGKKNMFVGEKNPVNTLHFNFIKNNFINSKFLFLTRNPLSIANSYKNRWLNKYTSEYFLFKVSVVIKTYFSSYLNYKNENNLILIKYEDIINKTTETLQKICNHLNVDYDEDMKYNLNTLFLEEKTKKYHENIDKKLNTKSIDKYLKELPKEEIESLKYLLRDVIDFFGYPNKIRKPTKKLIRLEKKINRRVKYNKSKTKRILLNFKYKIFYLKYLIGG